MPHLSPENIIIGLENNLEKLHAAAPCDELENSAAETKFAGRTHKQDRRMLQRRKPKPAPSVEAGTAIHAFRQPEREE